MADQRVGREEQGVLPVLGDATRLRATVGARGTYRAAVDEWLNTLTDPNHIAARVDAIVAADNEATPEPAEVMRAQRQHDRLRLDQLATVATRKIQADIATAESIIDRWEQSAHRPRPLTEVDVRDALTSAGGLVGLLAHADRTERTALYQALGIRLTYEKQTTGQDLVHARLQLSGGGGRI